jgi:hypothetical protein
MHMLFFQYSGCYTSGYRKGCKPSISLAAAAADTQQVARGTEQELETPPEQSKQSQQNQQSKQRKEYHRDLRPPKSAEQTDLTVSS